ncbi:hypothetical protein SLE2022_339930 [Rubroshorea leprosula]
MRKRIRLGNGASWTKCSSTLVNSAVYSSISSATMATRIISVSILSPATKQMKSFSALWLTVMTRMILLSIYMESAWGALEVTGRFQNFYRLPEAPAKHRMGGFAFSVLPVAFHRMF